MPKPNWKLLTKKRVGVTQGLPPDKELLAWVTNTVTLIYGERDAVLIDTFVSVQHSKALIEWLVDSGKNLTTIYITHAHGDHFLGLKPLLDRFPNARALATASTAKSNHAGHCPIVLGTAVSWSAAVGVCTSETSR